MNIRTIEARDLEALRAVVADTALFPPDMLDAMLASFLDDPTTAVWLCAADRTDLIAFAFAAPEPLTQGTWNMQALGVRSDRRRAGAATAVVRKVEREVAGRGARMLIVDTSGAPEFEAARAFYPAIGYDSEARIRDYWSAGDDKVVFRRVL